jgi:hypothetical protein
MKRATSSPTASCPTTGTDGQLTTTPEFSMGVHRVNVLLADGRVIPDVLISGKRVTWVFGEDVIPFRADLVTALLGQ